jgi:hypothetical protein
MIEDILRELRELTKFCYGLKTELAVISKNQTVLCGMIEDFENKIVRLDSITDQLEIERQRRLWLRGLGGLALRYWYLILAVGVCFVEGSSAAMKFLER